MKRNKFDAFVSSLKGKKKVLIVPHIGADVDAIASAAAFYSLLKKDYSPFIGLVEHLNLNAKALVENLGISYLEKFNVDDFDALIIVDLNSFDMLGSYADQIKKFKKPVFLADHHEKTGNIKTKEEFTVINEKAISTTEIIYDLISDSEKFHITPKIATLIACGIVTDSAGFLVSTPKTFRVMAEMLEKAEKSYSDISALLHVESTFAEKIAKIKAAKRAKIYKLGDYIICTSKISSYESDAANALVRLGADISFVGSADKKNIDVVRISSRARTKIVNQESLNLGKMMNSLSDYFDGAGGGHAGAAGFNGKVHSLDDVLEKCVDLAADFFKKNGKEFSLKNYTD